MNRHDPYDPPGVIGQCRICPKPAERRNLCSAHLNRWKRHGDPLAGRTENRPLNLEDIEWMAATGENATGAARRLGLKRGSLQKRLSILGRSDLYQVLAGREGDWNAPTNREAVVRQKRYDNKVA